MLLPRAWPWPWPARGVEGSHRPSPPLSSPLNLKGRSQGGGAWSQNEEGKTGGKDFTWAECVAAGAKGPAQCGVLRRVPLSAQPPRAPSPSLSPGGAPRRR